MAVLRDAGYTISVPFGENTRYDLVIDDGAELARVQCKTGRLKDGAVVFKTASTYAHHRGAPRSSRHYQGEIDFFGVFCRETEGVYFIPIDEVESTWQAMLRVTAPRNRQRRKIRFAADFEVGYVSVTAASRAPRASSGARGSSA
jgi:hypothetical protein